MNLQSTVSAIRPADAAYAKAAKQKWDAIAKPLGSLGLLEEFVSRICAMTGSLTPKVKKRCVAVFCADNGVVCEGVTQVGSEITAIVAKNLCIKKTSVCKMAKVASADVIPADIGMFNPINDSRIKNLCIAPGTKNIRSKRAMTREQAVLGIEKGIALAVELSKQGYELFATGEMGIGNTTTSSAIASVLLNRPVDCMTGPGAGLSKDGVAHKITVIEDAIRINDPDPQDPIDVLSALGGFDIAGMAGFCLGAALERKPCLIDGFISGVSALIAVRLCPDCADYLLASHVSAEPAGALVLQSLGLRPLISAGMRLGEGTGAVAAMPLLDMAFSVYDTMSTFEEVSIEAYRPL